MCDMDIYVNIAYINLPAVSSCIKTILFNRGTIMKGNHDVQQISIGRSLNKVQTGFYNKAMAGRKIQMGSRQVLSRELECKIERFCHHAKTLPI